MNKFNDIATLIEYGTVREAHFFEYAFPRIVTLTSRLDPFILLETARRDQRWGMRVRRVRWGAEQCYRMSWLYRAKACIADGVVLVEPSKPSVWQRIVHAVRLRLGRPVYLRTARHHRHQETEDLAIAEQVWASLAAEDRRFLQAAA